MNTLPLPKWCYRPQYLPVVVTPAGDFYHTLEQLHVEESPRYTPGKDTWCNIFAWDMSLNLGFALPHWVDKEGDPCAVGRGVELNANALLDWLSTVGVDKYHYSLESDFDDAVVTVKNGGFGVVVHKSKGEHGHIAVIRPDGWLCQAGRKCYKRASLHDCFGKLPTRIFTCSKRYT